jgi:DNA-binding LacI/PurR family transcriptional regulator
VVVDVAAEQPGPVVAITSALEVYQTGLLRGMRGVLGDAGIPLVAYVNHDGDAHSAPATVQPALRCLLHHHRPRGVIVTSSTSGPQAYSLARLIEELRLPAVYIGQEVFGADCVRGDNVQGTTALMAHLLDECGARKPVFVRGHAFQDDHVVREQVFRRELSARGIAVDEQLMLEGAAERETTRDALRRLIEVRRDFDAVVTTDDWCALAALDALTEAGLRVPHDAAVTGFDNYPAAALTWPGLTTVDQCLDEQGATAALRLLGLVGGAAPEGLVLTPANLVVRGSSSRSWQAEGPGSTETAIRSAQAHQQAHDAIRRVSRALLSARTLPEVGEALAASLPLLEVRRCFLVVHEGPAGHGPDGVPHGRARLVLDYRDGTAQPVPDGTFSACSRLPDRLAAELSQGFLAHQPLIGTNGPLGYLLTDHPLSTVTTADSLRLSLTRTLEIVFNTQELADRVEARTAELRAMQRELVDTARRAGMAEIATNVLHNVGNVLNSVNVSAGLVTTKLRGSKLDGLGKVAALLAEHESDLAGYLGGEQGRLIPGYLSRLAGTLGSEQAEMVAELAQLTRNIDHIKDIVATQQSYAGPSSVVESVRIADLVHDALRMNAESLARHGVEVVLDGAVDEPLLLDRARVVLILVNLIRNAKYAMEPVRTRQLTIASLIETGDGPARLHLSVSDTGVGIEDLNRIFTRGYTTRDGGHGFGLHSCALAATEMGGSLGVRSDGRGTGATFTLELPVDRAGGAR